MQCKISDGTMNEQSNYSNSQLSTRNESTDNRLDKIASALTNGFLKFLARFSGRRRLEMLIHRKQTNLQNSQDEHHQHNSRISDSLSHHRNSKIQITLFVFLLLSTLCNLADACSSRTTPRPRPSATTTPRPNITFHTYRCPPAYAAWYCLNDATCFTVKIGESLLYNCECADGYMGPRCEYKDLDGSYLATRPRVMLETASIAGGAVAALFLVLVLGFFAYVRWHQDKKREQLDEAQSQCPGFIGDAVDGPEVCSCPQQVQTFNTYSNLSSTESGTVRNGDHPTNGVHVHLVPKLRPFGPHHDKFISMDAVYVHR